MNGETQDTRTMYRRISYNTAAHNHGNFFMSTRTTAGLWGKPVSMKVLTYRVNLSSIFIGQEHFVFYIVHPPHMEPKKLSDTRI